MFDFSDGLLFNHRVIATMILDQIFLCGAWPAPKTSVACTCILQCYGLKNPTSNAMVGMFCHGDTDVYPNTHMQKLFKVCQNRIS